MQGKADQVRPDYQQELDRLANELNPGSQNRSGTRRPRRRPPPVIKWAPVTDNAKSPIIDFANNAGIDLFSAEDATFYPVEAGGMYIATVKTTVIFELPFGVHGMVAGRSGNAMKRGTIPFYGIIDNSYRGNITIRLYTHSMEIAKQGIKKDTAIAQLIPINLSGMNLVRARAKQVKLEELSETERGDRGFGETTGNMV